MNSSFRIEEALEAALGPVRESCPPRLGLALSHAVGPGGSRFRPRLCLAVAEACGDSNPDLALTAATAIELLHCASLIYDDLPCFDDAELRRGRPSTHSAFGEELAILAGNALIVRSFELTSELVQTSPLRTGLILAALARSAGATHGITAGQAWESEPRVDLRAYHRAKTGALFEAAVVIGAIAGGGDARDWSGLGERLGEAYQIADDLRDAVGSTELLGKPVGQDMAHSRPSAVLQLGPGGAAQRVQELISNAIGGLPHCPGKAILIDFLMTWSESLTIHTHTTRVASAS